MVNKTAAPLFDPDRNGLVCQRLYRIAHFQVVLASAREPWELPRRNAINKEWIVECFRNLVAQRRHVLNSRAKKSGRNPTGKDRCPNRDRRDRRVEDDGVEAKHQRALRSILQIEDKSIGQQHNIQRVGGEMLCRDLLHHGVEESVVKKLVQQHHECAAIVRGAGEIRADVSRYAVDGTEKNRGTWMVTWSTIR